MAIDRKAIVDRLIGGNGSPGNPGFLPPSHPYHAAVEQYPFDPAAANRLLDGAGYRRGAGGLRRDPSGRPLRFQMLLGNNPVPPVLDLLVSALKAIGVELKPQAVDLPTFFARLQEQNDDVALSIYPGPSATALNADPDLLRTFYSSKLKGRLQGAQGWVNPEFDRLADRQLVTASQPERKRLIARMQRIVARELPALPLYYPNLYTVFRKQAFDQWYYTPGGFAGGLTGVYNKQALVTGRKVGLRIRRSG
jgi:peptide/nickel transport system substrate-binding protein